MSSGVGGTNVDNLGAGTGAQEEESDHQTLVVTNSKGTMVHEGPKGQEALRKATLKNGSTVHYSGSKGAERFHRVDKSDGSVEGYKGTNGGEWVSEIFKPGEETVLYGGGGKTKYKALTVCHVRRDVRIYKRAGEGATSSSPLRMVNASGQFFARRSEEDEWEEVVVSDEWLETKARERREARAAAAASERAKRAREEQEREKEKEKKERAKRKREAEARLGEHTASVGSYSGPDRADMYGDYYDMGDSDAFAPKTGGGDDE